MLILTLMPLRLNVSSSFLSYGFNISLVTVSRIFSDAIDVMYVRMKPLVVWPSRDELPRQCQCTLESILEQKSCNY